MSPASKWAYVLNVDAMLCNASVGVLLMRLYVPLSTRPVIALIISIVLAMFDDTQEKYSMLLFTQKGSGCPLPCCISCWLSYSALAMVDSGAAALAALAASRAALRAAAASALA